MAKRGEAILKDVTVLGSTPGEGFPLELAKALHEMAKAAALLAAKLDGVGSIGVLIGDYRPVKPNEEDVP